VPHHVVNGKTGWARKTKGPMSRAALSWVRRQPMLEPPQLACRRSAPLRPQTEQRAEARRRSLEASEPQRMISGVNAMGARCWQSALRQQTHHQGADLRSSSNVATWAPSDLIAVRRAATVPCWPPAKPGSSPSPNLTWFQLDKGRHGASRPHLRAPSSRQRLGARRRHRNHRRGAACRHQHP
jgi:hypothetical protein